MALSDDTRRALRAYDSFTDFARCPDLVWSPDTYERLDDEVAQIMLRAFCYAWAASQQAADVHSGSVADLADELFDALLTWDAQWSHQRKVEWTLSLGVKAVLFRSRPTSARRRYRPRAPTCPALSWTHWTIWPRIFRSRVGRRRFCSRSGARLANPSWISKQRLEGAQHKS
jgi:hypothetical protein